MNHAKMLRTLWTPKPRQIECVGEVPEAVLFLDMDGVVNGHEKHPNQYSVTNHAAVYRVNAALAAVPAAKVVMSSSWRYMVHTGTMNIEGLQNLLLSHGFDVHGRVLGVTCLDEEYQGDMTRPEFWDWIKAHGCEVRGRQIQKWLQDHPGWQTYAVLDDMPLPIDRQVHTHHTEGISQQEALDLAALLAGGEWVPNARCIECHRPLSRDLAYCAGCGHWPPKWQVR